MKIQSEFGKGLTYCLGLFLAHAERIDTNERDCSLWFYAAGDHIFELQIPETLPAPLQRKLKTFQKKVLEYRLSRNIHPREKQKAIDEAKKLLLAIDRHIGVDVGEASWS